MKSIVYTAWDGSQPLFSLKRKDVVKAFMDNIMEGMDPNMSLARMLWEGFPLAGMDFQVMGLKDIVRQLEDKKNDLLSQYSLERVFDEPINALRDLLDDEAGTRREAGAAPSPEFDELPPGLLEKIRDLIDFPFSNRKSKETFEEWKDREGDIRELFEFYSTWARQFTGTKHLNFEEALELMRLFKALEQMQQQILSGQWSRIDPETLKELLGDEAQQSMMILLQVPGEISQQGLVQPSSEGFDLTPRGIRSLGELAFGDLYHMIKRDKQGSSRGAAPESGEIEPDSSRPYRFGDRFDLDISKTLLKSVVRQQSPGSRLALVPDDFYVREREQLITSTTVMLLDLSWSMSWQNRFQAAKRVALALDHYIRAKFPRDTFYVVGFSTEAKQLRAKELALAVWETGYAFTNLQAGVRKAAELIKRSGTRNNRMIILTDGQPTAYFQDDQLRVEFPSTMYGISPNACRATLEEVRRVTAEGIHIDSFMLDNSPVLVEFMREIARINGGKAVICVPGELGRLILLEEIQRRKHR